MSNLMKKPKKPALRILVIGRGGQGKSTLINNFLVLEGGAAAKAEKSAKPVTEVVAEYHNEVNNVTVYVYDTPGLQDHTVDERKVVKEVEKLTKGVVDILFYVSSLNDRINASDGRIIAAITAEFKPEIWEHTVLVLTHADQHCNDDKYIKYTNGFAGQFQSYVVKQRGCRNFRVKCIQQRTDETPGKYDPFEIAAIPTGLDKDKNPDGWYYNLFIEAVNKCQNQATPLLLIATHAFGGKVGVTNASLISGMAMQFAGKGAVIGGIAGSVTAATAGVAFVIPTGGLSIPAAVAIGGGAGAGLGAAAGATVGAAVGTATVIGLYLWPIIKRKKLLEQLKKDQ